MVGIIAMAVGVMLSSSTSAIRQSADRLTYEEAYQTALSGTHIARAWLIDPALAGKMAGNPGSIQADLESLISKATTMNQKISDDVSKNINTNLYGTQRYTNEGFAVGSTVSGGRKVLYTFPMSPVAAISTEPTAADDLFDTPASKRKTYVEWVRLTTPGTDAATSASLREVTFIVEAKGVTQYGNRKKERVVQQRVLIKPNKPAAPLISANESILTTGNFSTKEMSSGNVHWGPVLAKLNITNAFLDAITPVYGSGQNKNTIMGWKFPLNQAQKANIAGLPVADSGNNSHITEMDTRLRWMAGTQGKLYAGQQGTDYMFKDIPSTPAGEFDFFKSLMANQFTETNLNLAKFELDQKFGQAGTNLSNNPNGLYTSNNGDIQGALVQGSPAVDQKVDQFFSELSYAELKSYAQSHNGYYTWDGSKLRDAANNVVQSIPTMVPGNQDTLAANASPDKLLFIDSVAGSESKPFTTAIQLPSFWKGVVYANGPIYTSGSGSSPDVLVRSPEQFSAYRQGTTPPTAPKVAKGVFVDGIVICNGTADLGANGCIYGTLAAKGGVITGANFSVFYNSANGEGRLKDTSTGPQPFNLIAGRLYETAVPSS